ncbi:hypothetical protein E2C01_075132 [Portunus trituberculatus]|uniref:Uncharacterized protein n=1 Tax=Portunus trituberculatus TaxID=210409 RepID=A0A5B7I9Y2_PORTR|nr:hypothetical protein [Portunus trituberculatus]
MSRHLRVTSRCQVEWFSGHVVQKSCLSQSLFTSRHFTARSRALKKDVSLPFQSRHSHVKLKTHKLSRK